MTNPVTVVRHMTKYGSDDCLGLHVWMWCPGCGEAHAPTFRCPDHGGPAEGPVWEGDPYSDPFDMNPSLMSYGSKRCHSFIHGGVWQFLDDCEHDLRGLHPMVPLPDWLVP